MAYLQEAVTTMAAIPARIAAFATTRGWTVAGTTLTRPGGGRSFEITQQVVGLEDRLTVTDTADATRAVVTVQPYTRGAFNAPTQQPPTKIHLFGNDAPHEPGAWIAVVIEFGFNLYRHVYIGNLAKIGDYTGGEVISANLWPPARYSENARAYTSANNRYLFGAKHINESSRGFPPGGVNVVHADNPVPWRKFSGPYTGSSGGGTHFMAGDEVFGGAGDGLSDGLVRRSQSDYAGASILTPINLFVPDSGDGSDTRFRPIGIPPGVRMVDMRSLDAGAVIQVGNENWHVFPEFRKTTNTFYSTDNLGYYFDDETSYYLGLAYREG